jgi:poly-gamma-glutamate capsule biosynthesis protein CapA/YwtB (metallophosphatase superfamily)
MTVKPIRFAMLFAVTTFAIVIAFGRQSKTQATVSAPAGYEYKVELVKHSKDLEGLLREDGRNGWRIQSVVTRGANHNDLVVILEKPGNAP